MVFTNIKKLGGKIQLKNFDMKDVTLEGDFFFRKGYEQGNVKKHPYLNEWLCLGTEAPNGLRKYQIKGRKGLPNASFCVFEVNAFPTKQGDKQETYP